MGESSGDISEHDPVRGTREMSSGTLSNGVQRLTITGRGSNDYPHSFNDHNGNVTHLIDTLQLKGVGN